MSIAKFVGRNKELQLFKKIYAAGRSRFAAVFGRRRIGKTMLIRKAFNDQFTFYVTGIANTNKAMQLANFHAALLKQSKTKVSTTVPENWFEAFQLLINSLERSRLKRKVVFLDELPWFDTAKSGFIQSLEHFWNSWASFRNDIVLVVCGSTASWMINKLINHKGGLHNRVTEKIHLEPFNLKETELFLKSINKAITRYQIIQLYMVFGGVPFYLENISKEWSITQNIEHLCFNKNGLLRTEFHNLFKALFSKHERHIAIVKAMATKAKGLTRSELIKISKLANSGRTTNILDELEKSGFIRRYIPFQKKTRDSLYQLIDFYTLFYLRFIEKSNPEDRDNWINAIDSPSYRAWSGYAFEQVCLQHLQQIKEALRIGGIISNSSSWKSTASKNKKGAQIDLLINRRDGVINLCEMKYATTNFVINKAYATQLQQKINTFKEESKTKKAIHLTMITTNGVKQNNWAVNLLHNNLTMDILFK